MTLMSKITMAINTIAIAFLLLATTVIVGELQDTIKICDLHTYILNDMMNIVMQHDQDLYETEPPPQPKTNKEFAKPEYLYIWKGERT